ncbi:MAG: type IV toxin-antitoxin system AbiEi family antitoxin domain-containing protein [Candidatus Omnitrophota bacterium]
MNYLQFKNRFQNIPIIRSRDLTGASPKGQNMRNQLLRWQKKGLILRLRRGVYLLNENDRKINPSRCFLANQIYGPSYISLEYAMNFYGLIPEKVADVTSVTTKKTFSLKNKLGLFIYKHIKSSGFSGFKLLKEPNGLPCLIAVPEKAIIDFLYFNLKRIKGRPEDLFKYSYRLQNLEKISRRKIMLFALSLGNKKLIKIAGVFCDFVKKEKRNV